MSATEAPRALPIDLAGKGSSGWWVMVLVIASEAMFFVYLLFSYVYVASVAGASWPAGAPSLTLAAPNTVLLLASSGTIWRAERAIAHGDLGRTRTFLLATAALGTVFLGVQGIEFVRETFPPRGHAYRSLFVTITGFHAAHVAAGLLMLLFVLARAWRGHFDARRHLAVRNAAMYWHFVDAVWVAVFTTLYVAAHLR